MTVKLRLENSISETERQQLFNWGEDVFGLRNLDWQWRPKDRHIFVELDDRVVSHVGLLRHTVTAGEQPIVVEGVGGVVTVPDMQGRGFAGRALRHAESLMREEPEVEFGLLFCREPLVSFYRRLGWQLLHDPVWFEQESGQMISPLPVMALPCRDQAWPTGVVNLHGLPW